ncbi:MAG TPA: carboxypeptidase-like regulatory domain-containing protein [Cyclobacteriaceae bacterium]|nr:carboxypeptidase-like regulatory domain-containing protein [Cyclobacteriaceae bacterium]
MKNLKTPAGIAILIFALCFVSGAYGQSIKGVVKDGQNGEPLPFANVFIDNSTIGTTTDDKGNFTLSGLSAGSVSLVISFVGYKTYAAQIVIAPDRTVEIAAVLIPDKKVLGEIEVRASRDKGWEKLFKRFEREFLGVTHNARKSRILNPWVIDLIESGDTLTASASEPVEIENLGLGYRISFIIVRFQFYATQYTILGRTKFKRLMPLDEKQNKEWTRNRLEAYLGTEQHLFQAMIDGSFSKAGFELYLELKDPKESDKIIRSNLFRNELGKRVVPFSFSMAPIKSPTYKIVLPSRLEIHYVNDSAHPFYRDIAYRVFWIDVPNRVVELNAKGILMDPTTIRSSGYTRILRVADMLPNDYDPAETAGFKFP